MVAALLCIVSEGLKGAGGRKGGNPGFLSHTRTRLESGLQALLAAASVFCSRSTADCDYPPSTVDSAAVSIYGECKEEAGRGGLSENNLAGETLQDNLSGMMDSVPPTPHVVLCYR